MKIQKEKCGSVCGDLVCELVLGHSFKHRQAGSTWTDQGAERIKKETAESAAKESK